MINNYNEIKKIDINKLSINIKKISKNSFFMKLYNDLEYIIKNTKIDKDKLIIKKCNEISNDYLVDSDFTSQNIKDYINKNLKYCNKISYENNSIIYFSSSEKNNIPIFIKKMMFIIIIIKKLFDRKYDQKVIFFETNKKKEFPNKKKIEILNSNNINTAFTIIEFGNKNGDILLYRKEECIKVLIHELVHSNLVDELLIYSNKSKDFKHLFCSNYKVLLNECVTESLACIINIFIISICCNKSKKELDKMFYNECLYSNYICSKIKSYYKIDFIKNIIKNKNSNKECITYFPQYTNVLSYYFLKNILLINHLSYGELYKKYNKKYKIVNEKFIDDIIKLLINDINKIDKRLTKIEDKNKSLKMSYYEII
jgi:hypothetical protein